MLGLPDPDNFGERFPHQVSGGQLQRAMTAMALCSEPDLIVFDEPTTALDVTTQIDVLAAIKRAIDETGTAALYITHDLAVVAQVADDIMVLRHGKTVEWGGTRQIIEAPREEYTNAWSPCTTSSTSEKKPDRPPILSRRERRRRLRQAEDPEERLGRHPPGPDARGRGRIRLGKIDAGARRHRAAAARAGRGHLRRQGAAAPARGPHARKLRSCR